MVVSKFLFFSNVVFSVTFRVTLYAPILLANNVRVEEDHDTNQAFCFLEKEDANIHIGQSWGESIHIKNLFNKQYIF
jgi:hypothetical protein